MKQKINSLLALLSMAIGLQAQAVLLGEGSMLRGRGLCEPSISINPKNPDNIVAGSVLDAVFYSFDGGRTWTHDTLVSSFGVWGDPVLISDTAGNHYYLHLSDPTGKNWSSSEILDRIVIQKSSDGGKTWSNGSYTGLAHPKDQDKHWAVVDSRTNAIHLSWTQFDKYGSADSIHQSNILYSRSEDGGKSWTEPLQINRISGDCLDGDSTTEGAVPVVIGNRVYVAWANQNKLFLNFSEDAGATWQNEDILITEQAGGWDIDVPGVQRANGLPVLIADTLGRLYINWVDDRAGNYDVWFSYSDDQGSTWSAAQKVNQDSGTADQFFTWMCVDPITNVLYAVYYDRRGLKGNFTNVYLARSKDRGASWEEFCLTEEAFETRPLVFFGDYNHIDAHGGRVRPIWTQIEGLKMGVWTYLWED